VKLTPIQGLAVGLVAGTVALLSGIWLPLILAFWAASLARPTFKRLYHLLGGRARAGAAVTILLLVAVLAPAGALLVSLGASALGLVESVTRTADGRAALEALVAAGGDEGTGAVDVLAWPPGRVADLLREHGARAWSLAVAVAGATASAVLRALVLVAATYAFLVDGPRGRAWLEANVPLDPEHLRRLLAAVEETGRGLFVGAGLTALTQASIASVTYAALGVPRPLVLGVLTFMAAFVPAVGTALVWLPVAVGLALRGHVTQALVLLGVGMLVVATIDNLLRPVFARFGKLQMPAVVVLLSMIGGLLTIGPSGLILGPLATRLTLEVLALVRA